MGHVCTHSGIRMWHVVSGIKNIVGTHSRESEGGPPGTQTWREWANPGVAGAVGLSRGHAGRRSRTMALGLQRYRYKTRLFSPLLLSSKSSFGVSSDMSFLVS